MPRAVVCPTMILPPLLVVAAAVGLPVPATAQTVPVIDSVTMHEDAGGRYPVIYPEFHFHDSSGTVRFIHREVVATNASKALPIQDGVIDISANQQIRGATYVGGWHCGPESYYVTLRAFIMNLEGAKSNIVEYTIHCNGG
jgi:hypothetical protein